jgi:AcrR family transcriptional regulator
MPARPRPRARRAPRGRPSYHHGNLHRALVDAATHLLDRRGIAGVTLRGAAREAGVSQAAPYRHFASKDALLAAVAGESFRALNDTLEAAAAGMAADPVRRLAVVAGAYLRFAVEHPARYRLMWSPTPSGRDHPGLHAAAGAAGGALLRLVQECGRDGHLGPGSEVEALFAIWALLHGVAALVVEDQLPRGVRDAVPPEALAGRAMEILLQGILPRN